jgi:hypothetical protein
MIEHIFQRRAGRDQFKDLRLRLAQRLGEFPLRDVIMRRHPAAVGQRLMANEDRAAIPQPRRPGLGDGGQIDAIAPGKIFFHRPRRACPDRETPLRNLPQGPADRDILGRKTVDFRVATVAQPQPLLSVENANALRDLVESGLEAQPLRLERCGRRSMVEVEVRAVDPTPKFAAGRKRFFRAFAQKRLFDALLPTRKRAAAALTQCLLEHPRNPIVRSRGENGRAPRNDSTGDIRTCTEATKRHDAYKLFFGNLFVVHQINETQYQFIDFNR